ncbi:MAG: class A beta-lactamase-related serine hydrolase [Goleter apudmare HA4340-LM2]|nr:class A beta-lactamase-related serine hydrolase [Goleter apudmare HA4340-LM2]
MEPNSQQQPDISEQKTAELEASLQHANQVIAHLKKQNIELQQQINEVQGSTTPISAPDQVRDRNQTNIVKRRVKKIHPSDSKFVRNSYFPTLNSLQFYGLTSLVVVVILGLFGLGTLMARKQNSKESSTGNNPSVQSPKRLPQPPSSPIAPTNNPINSLQEVPNAPPINPNISPPIQPNPPVLGKNDKLENIVDGLVNRVKNQNLPTDSLSITLIDLNTQTIAGYQQNTGRYPASVVKLFWMVILQAQIQQGSINQDAELYNDLNKMIVKSDNDASSRIIDRITGDKSRIEALGKEEFKQWKQKRQAINLFFQKAGYQDMNISQKTFPIPYLDFRRPIGTDLQIRGDDLQKPIRNKITTYQAARLMYEISNFQAVDIQSSQQMMNLLKRDLRTEVWKQDPPNLEEFNPVENFFGESLSSENVIFASKAGWTTASRQEVAYVATPDGKVRYVLAVFGDDPAYGKSKKIFPELSRIVFERMSNR